MTRATVIVCDTWDTHWCETLAARIAELAPRIDSFLRQVRSDGVIIHAPSQTERFYRHWPQYERARALRRERPEARAVPGVDLPVLDGCGCEHRRCDPPDPQADPWPWPWRRQHDAIVIDDHDFIVCEDGDAAYGVIQHMAPGRVFICGVHTDQCILDRPFGLRALWRAGIDVTLLADLTEASKPTATPAVVRAIAEVLPVAESSDVL